MEMKYYANIEEHERKTSLEQQKGFSFSGISKM